jgi:AraC-like DNA-binding protein
MNTYFDFAVAEKVIAYPPHTHYHPDYEVYYLMEGRCRYFIHDKTYTMMPGDLVMIPPGVIHKVIYETPSHSRMLFNCTADYLHPSVLPFVTQLAYFPERPDTAVLIASLYRKIREAVEQPDDFSRDTIRCSVMQLFLLMAKVAAHSTPLPSSSPFVEQAVSYIRANYANHFTLSDTARHCAVSPEHLSRVFKKETGFGFHEYVNLYRLKKAESLLKSGQAQSVSQVAMLCGFSDSNYFSGIFKKMYGIPPSRVKKQHQEGHYV